MSTAHPRSTSSPRVATSVATALALLLPAVPLAAQPLVEWVQPGGGVSIAVDAANASYVVHTVQQLGAEMVVTKRDVDGDLLWTSSYDQTDPTKWERASWIVTDSAGCAVVCGTLMSGYSNPVEAASIAMKFAPDGTVLWRRVYESGFDGSSTRRCLVDGDDNVYVLGLGSGPSGFVTKIKKLAPDGSDVWNWFDSDGIGAPTIFKLTPDDAILVACRGIVGAVNGYAKVDLDGNTLWALAGVLSLTVGDVAGDAAGDSYAVHGEYVANGGTQVKKLDPSGAVLWDRVYPHAAFRVEVGPDGLPILAGFPSTTSGGVAMTKLDGDGEVVWTNPDADGPSYALLLHAQLVVDGSGDAYLAAGTLFAMAVCKVGADGSSRWTQTVPGSYAYALALSPSDDSVFVVGGNTSRWSDPEEGPWHDLGQGLAGASGVPWLVGDGPLLAGTPFTWTLAGAAPARPLVLVLGVSQLGLPFKGGVLVPSPDVVIAGLVSDAQGGLVLGATTPAGLTSGAQLFVQEWIGDPLGPAGWSASHGLRATLP